MSSSENMAQRVPLVDGAPTACKSCQGVLCLRQQVINLALGQIDTMSCLRCLADENAQSEMDVVDSIVPYILSRDCFAKEWRRVSGIEDCSVAGGCHVALCSKTSLAGG